MNDEFVEDEKTRTICSILGKEELVELANYIAINECLERLDPKEMEKFRRKMLYKPFRKRSLEGGRFLGR